MLEIENTQKEEQEIHDNFCLNESQQAFCIYEERNHKDLLIEDIKCEQNDEYADHSEEPESLLKNNEKTSESSLLQIGGSNTYEKINEENRDEIQVLNRDINQSVEMEKPISEGGSNEKIMKKEEEEEELFLNSFNQTKSETKDSVREFIEKIKNLSIEYLFAIDNKTEVKQNINEEIIDFS